MALNKENLKSDLKSIFEATINDNSGAEASLEKFVDDLSGVLIKHIKTLDIRYVNGLVAPNGAVTGTINHTVE